GQKLRMARPDPRRQRHALMLAVMADRRMKDELGSTRCKLRSVLAGDERQHHVECRGSACRGEAVAVDLEQAAGRIDFRESFGEAREVLPMNGAAITVEDSSLGQDMGAGAHRTDVQAAP